METSEGPRTTKKRILGPKGPKTSPLDDGARGGQAPALREHRDREVSPTGGHRDWEVSPTGNSPFSPYHGTGACPGDVERFMKRP